MSPDDAPKRPRRPKRVLKVLAGLVVALTAVALAAKWWIVPAVVRSEVTAALANYWSGPVELAEVDFSYFGARPVRLSGLRLTDADGRPWVSVGTIELSLRDWPSVHPYLTGVDVDRIEVNLHVSGGACRPPLLEPAAGPKGGASDYLDVQAVRLAQLVVATIDHDRDETRTAHFAFKASREGPSPYRVRLDQTAPAARAGKLLWGDVDADTLAARLDFQLASPLGPDLTPLLAAAMPGRALSVTGGTLDVRGRLAGRLDQPLTLRHDVTLDLAGLRIDANDARVLDNLTLRMRLADGNGVVEQATAVTPAATLTLGKAAVRYDVGKLTARAQLPNVTLNAPADANYGAFWGGLLGGVRAAGSVTAAGEVSFDANRSQPLGFDLEVRPDISRVRFASAPKQDLRNITAARFHVRPDELDLRDLSAEFAQGRAKLSGTLRLAAREPGGYALSDWARPERLIGGGHLAMDDVDLVSVPILPGLLQVMQVLPKGQRGVSDLQAFFVLKDGVVTVDEGKLANPISALAAQRGGTIDLRSKQLDLVVVVVAIKQLRGILKSIPLVNLAVGFKDRLARFQVKGPWDDPPAKLIRKQPVEDLGKGTEEFFTGVIKAGGQIGPGIVKGIGSLFQELDKGLRKKPNP